MSDLARLITDNLMGNPAEKGGGPVAAPVSDVGMIAGMAQGFARMNQGIETLAGLMPKLIEMQAEQLTLTRSMLQGVDRLTQETTEMREASLGVASAFLPAMNCNRK